MKRESARFLANMIVLEEETATHCQQLAQVALAAGDDELEAFLLGLAETSRIDVDEALADGAERHHASFRPTPVSECLLASPVRGGHTALLGVHCALSCVLTLVRRNYGYYASVAASARSNALREQAAGFECERAAHIAALEHWVLRLTA